MTVYDITTETLENTYPAIAPRLRTARFAVALTGAGISKASGLPLYRETVSGMPVRRFFERESWERDPEGWFQTYRQVLLTWRTARPNPAHHALVRAGTWVITQNIDGLHRDAGTRHLIELHGNLRELVCPDCGQKQTSALAWKYAVPRCPGCDAVLKPAIVFAGEEVRHFSLAVDWVGRAEVFAVVGTRLEMDPVRSLISTAERHGADVLWINEDAERIVPLLFATRWEEQKQPALQRTDD